MRRLIALVAALALPTFLVGCAPPVVITSAAAVAKASLSVDGQWVRATTAAKDTSMTAAFMTIANPGEADVKLTSAECPDAGVVQLHEVAMKESTTIMEETKEGIPVPAGGQAELEPGGYHLMLMMLKRRLPVGGQVTITLHFSDGGSLVVQAPVKETVLTTTPARAASPTAQASS